MSALIQWEEGEESLARWHSLGRLQAELLNPLLQRATAILREFNIEELAPRFTY